MIFRFHLLLLLCAFISSSVTMTLLLRAVLVTDPIIFILFYVWHLMFTTVFSLKFDRLRFHQSFRMANDREHTFGLVFTLKFIKSFVCLIIWWWCCHLSFTQLLFIQYFDKSFVYFPSLYTLHDDILFTFCCPTCVVFYLTPYLFGDSTI